MVVEKKPLSRPPTTCRVTKFKSSAAIFLAPETLFPDPQISKRISWAAITHKGQSVSDSMGLPSTPPDTRGSIKEMPVFWLHHFSPPQPPAPAAHSMSTHGPSAGHLIPIPHPPAAPLPPICLTAPKAPEAQPKKVRTVSKIKVFKNPNKHETKPKLGRNSQTFSNSCPIS